MQTAISLYEEKKKRIINLYTNRDIDTREYLIRLNNLYYDLHKTQNEHINPNLKLK